MSGRHDASTSGRPGAPRGRSGSPGSPAGPAPGDPARPGQPAPTKRPGGSIRPGPQAAALDHPLRIALLELLSRRGTLTATEAARELGESSGACSFHLRQLERYGYVREVPGRSGRARPWRLAPATPAEGPQGGAADPAGEFGQLARELEDEGYRRWLAGRATAPPGWHDEAFSAVLYLTPAEMTEIAAAIRAVIAARGRPVDPRRTTDPSGQPDAVMPVGVVARMFPLLPASSDG